MPCARIGTDYSAPGKQVGGRAQGGKGTSNRATGRTSAIISDVPYQISVQELDKISKFRACGVPGPPKASPPSGFEGAERVGPFHNIA